MDKETSNELADKLAMNLKSEEDVSEMTRMLTKVAIERALEIEMEEHLGEKSKGRRKDGNSRNGYTPKTLKTDTAEPFQAIKGSLYTVWVFIGELGLLSGVRLPVGLLRATSIRFRPRPAASSSLSLGAHSTSSPS